jgi:hypothetical protein
MRYRNVFKMFGNPAPRECASKEAYAEHLLGFFDPSGRYSVTRPSPETTCGSAREINWQRRVWQAALEQYEQPDDKPEYVPNDLVLPIERRVLLQFLAEAVEEVQA